MNCQSCLNRIACKATKIRHCDGRRYSDEPKYKIGSQVRFSNGREVMTGTVTNTYRFSGSKYFYTIKVGESHKRFDYIHENFIYNEVR